MLASLILAALVTTTAPAPTTPAQAAFERSQARRAATTQQEAATARTMIRLARGLAQGHGTSQSCQYAHVTDIYGNTQTLYICVAR